MNTVKTEETERKEREWQKRRIADEALTIGGMPSYFEYTAPAIDLSAPVIETVPDATGFAGGGGDFGGGGASGDW